MKIFEMWSDESMIFEVGFGPVIFRWIFMRVNVFVKYFNGLGIFEFGLIIFETTIANS